MSVKQNVWFLGFFGVGLVCLHVSPHYSIWRKVKRNTGNYLISETRSVISEMSVGLRFFLWKMRMLVSISGSPFCSHLLWGKRQEVRSRSQKMDSFPLNKLYSQWEHFRLCVNLLIYFGHSHPSYPTPFFLPWYMVLFEWPPCQEGVGSRHGSPSTPDTQASFHFSASGGPRTTLFLGHPDSGPKYWMPEYAVLSLNCPI